MSKQGWHGESYRHSLAARGIDTRTPIRPLTRIDIEDELENVRGTGRTPVWVILAELFSKDDPLFYKMLDFYGWRFYEDNDIVGFYNKEDNKTITVDKSNTVSIMDHSILQEKPSLDEMHNFTEVHRFNNFDEAFIFACKQVSYDMKDKERYNLTR